MVIDFENGRGELNSKPWTRLFVLHIGLRPMKKI